MIVSRLLHGRVILLFSIMVAASIEAASAAEQARDFDLTAQPLASALDAFSVATGFMVVYNGDLTIGRNANPVLGRFPPKAALLMLLKGSGLAAEYTSPNAFVVIPSAGISDVVESPTAIAMAALSRQDAIERRYSGLIQQRINEALCSRRETMPGTYRAAISFQIGVSGEVTRLKLLSSTGDRERDDAIVGVAARAVIGEPPPPHLAQPLTMVVLPKSSGGAIECSSAEGSRQHG